MKNYNASALICMLLMATQLGWSQSAAKPAETAALVDQAAAAMKEGKFDRALELYGQARAVLPNNAEIPYNMGVAAYRQGDYAKAAEHLKDAVGLTNDAKLRQSGTYNLGNAAYAQSLKAMQGQADPAQAQRQLTDASKHVKEALQQFKQAMDADARDEDARVNAELSHRLLKQLEQMQQQMQQQQQQQQNQDQQDKQQQQNQNQQNQEQQDQNQQQSNQDQQNQEQQEQQQKTPEQSSTQPEQKPNEKIEAQEQEQPQTQPEDKGERPATSQPGQRKQMTREAAERMLQLVRDKERKRRELLNRREAMKYAPAEKDW